MRRRRLLLGAGALALVGLATWLALTAGTLGRRPALRAAAGKVGLGMTDAEVEGLMGGPPTCTGKGAPGIVTWDGPMPACTVRMWEGSDGSFFAYFSGEGTLLWGVWEPRQSALDHLRGLLRR
jgi:hypothetical protein